MRRPSVAPLEKISLQSLLSETAAKFGDKIAVIDGERSFSFNQLDEYSNRLASGLTSIGAAKGDRVGVLAPNCVEFVIAFYGIVKAGAVVSTLNSGYREREIAHQLNDSGAEILIVHESLLETLEKARADVPRLSRTIVIGTDTNGPDSFWGLVNGASPTPPDVDIDPETDLAALPYSSGTTGISKGVMLTHFNLTSNVQQMVKRKEAATPTEEDVILVHLPLFHIYGMNILMNASLAVGATQVMMGRFDMEEFLALLSRHRVTILYTVPPVMLGLTQYPAAKDYDLSALRFGFCGAAPLSGELQQRVSSILGFPVLQGYGLTETSPYCNSDYLEPHLTKPGSIGPAGPDMEEKVVDVETGTVELEPNERDRRAAGQGPSGNEGLLQQPGGDRRDDHRGRVASHWRHSEDGRRRVRVGAGPQERAHQVQGLPGSAGRARGTTARAPRRGRRRRCTQAGRGSRRGAEGVRRDEAGSRCQRRRHHVVRCRQGRHLQACPRGSIRGCDPQEPFRQDSSTCSPRAGARLSGPEPLRYHSESGTGSHSPPLAIDCWLTSPGTVMSIASWIPMSGARLPSAASTNSSTSK